MLSRLSAAIRILLVIRRPRYDQYDRPALFEVKLPQGIDFTLQTPTPQKHLIENHARRRCAVRL